MTDTREKMLLFIRDFASQFGYPPSVREIMKHFQFKSPRAVSFHLEKLETEGFVERHGKARGLRLQKFLPDAVLELPIYGVVPASDPEKRAEQALGGLAIRPGLIAPGQTLNAYGLRVKGDSMEGAKIFDGDIAVVECRAPRNDDVVVALVGGESTLKRLVIDNGRSFLKAENPRYPDPIPFNELAIQGVVIGVYRSMPSRTGAGA